MFSSGKIMFWLNENRVNIFLDNCYVASFNDFCVCPNKKKMELNELQIVCNFSVSTFFLDVI